MQENTVWKRFTSFLISNSPGMRVIKTFLAITICLIIEHFRATSMPYHSSIAAIVCMQPTLKSTFKTAGDRTIGTLIAGLYSFLFITAFLQQMQMTPDSLGYYILIGAMTLPLMMLIIALKKQGGLAITVVVFILIVINAGETNPLNYTIERVVGTLIGIGVALFINWLPILNRIGKHLGHVDISPVSAASSNIEMARPELTGKRPESSK